MQSVLPLLVRRNGKLTSLAVLIEEKTRQYKKASLSYKVVTASLIEERDGQKLVIDEFDSGLDDVWGGVSQRILLSLKVPFNDVRDFRWPELKKPIVDYWVSKQEAEIAEQKKRNARTIYTPAGDYTLWSMARFITNVLITKSELLDKKVLLDYLEKAPTRAFEHEFTKLVLTPIAYRAKIENVIAANKQDDEKVKEVIDLVIAPRLTSSGSYERILDPEYKDDTPFLGSDEERELKALWGIYEEVEKSINENKRLSKIEKQIKRSEFWDSYQGRRLNQLNAGRVRGGGLTGEEKEKRKRASIKEIREDIEIILESWGFAPDVVDRGLDYFQLLYEKAVAERWESEKHFRDVIARAKAEEGLYKEILKGSWDSNSLTLFGVIISIAISVSFGVASLVPSNKALWGIGVMIISVIILIFLVKWMLLRKWIILFMNNILKN